MGVAAEAHYAHCEALLRAEDRDLWLACLFAPQPARKHLHAIHAFVRETGDVRAKVTQPLLVEMRLRWWADALEQTGDAAGEGARAHPIADALLDTIDRFALPRAEFLTLIEARIFDLYDDPAPTLASLEDYARAVGGGPFRWAAQVLGGHASSPAFDDAGVARLLTRALWLLPAQAEGQSYVPTELLARHGVGADDLRARRDSAGLCAALADLRAVAAARFLRAREGAASLTAERAALLPAATTPLYLERLARRHADPFRPLAEPSPLRRQWRLWRAAHGVGL